jgi:hypothetical protein
MVGAGRREGARPWLGWCEGVDLWSITKMSKGSRKDSLSQSSGFPIVRSGRLAVPLHSKTAMWRVSVKPERDAGAGAGASSLVCQAELTPEIPLYDCLLLLRLCHIERSSTSPHTQDHDQVLRRDSMNPNSHSPSWKTSGDRYHM